jgi:hypothetical protein
MTLTYDQREALRMLAGSPNGSTESIMMAHGFGMERFTIWCGTGSRPRSGGPCARGGG